MGCSGHKPYHPHAMGDPSAYQAHFPDMDTNGDELVDWQEFKGHSLPQTSPHVFQALDINQDGACGS